MCVIRFIVFSVAAEWFIIYSQFVTTVHLLVIIYEVHIYDFTLWTNNNLCIYKDVVELDHKKKQK